MSDLQSFSDKVFEAVRNIPEGKVSTYGEIALVAGKPRGARVVGYVLHNNKEPVVTPCHRVVFKNGSLTDGFAFGGRDAQRELLLREGVVFLGDGRVDMTLCRHIYLN